MTKPNLFEYLSYRQYLKDTLESEGPRSGLKRQAAEALRVHTTFISQVVAGKAEISLDQAEDMNSFLKHGSEESEYFLDLVVYERAGNPLLRKRFETKLKARQTERAQIGKRLERTREVRSEDQAQFYSSHLYGLLHVLSSIPEYQTRERLERATGFPSDVAKGALDFLLRIGVLKMKAGAILPGEQHVHLSKESKQIRQHHTNWRTAALQKMAFARPDDLHYSLVFSCSEADAVRIRESLLQHLKSITKIVEGSKEQHAYVYNFDFLKW